MFGQKCNIYWVALQFSQYYYRDEFQAVNTDQNVHEN